MKQLLNALFTPYSSYKLKSFGALVAIQAVIFIVAFNGIPNTGIPSFADIGAAWVNLAAKEGLVTELIVSSKTIALSLLLSTAITAAFVYLSTAAFFKPPALAASSLRFLGFVGLTFLFTLWTSGATQLKLCLLTFVISCFMITNFIAEVESIPGEIIDYAKTLKMKGWRITWEIVVLGRAHVLLDLIRQNAAIGWTSLTMVEGITRSQGGIGALLMNQNRHFDLAAILAIQLTILAYGIAQDYILAAIRNYVCPYAVITRH